AAHLSTARAGFETLDVGVGEQTDVPMGERRVDADRLRVGLGADQARKAIARVAADALARPSVQLVELDAERHVKRTKALRGKVFRELADTGLVAHRRMGIRAACRRIERVLATLAVHLVEPLGARVVSLELVVRDRPRGRDAAVVANLA